MCYLSSVEIDHMLLVIFCADDLHAAIDVFRECAREFDHRLSKLKLHQ